jgi:hypothetical protein
MYFNKNITYLAALNPLLAAKINTACEPLAVKANESADVSVYMNDQCVYQDLFARCLQQSQSQLTNRRSVRVARHYSDCVNTSLAVLIRQSIDNHTSLLTSSLSGLQKSHHSNSLPLPLSRDLLLLGSYSLVGCAALFQHSDEIIEPFFM